MFEFRLVSGSPRPFGPRDDDVILASRARDGGAQLIVTHSLAVARTADRILTLEDGVVREAGDGLAW